jgi:hypothetical protein
MSLGVDEGAIAGRRVDACGLPFECLHSLDGERLELVEPTLIRSTPQQRI